MELVNCDCGKTRALCIVKDKTYQVKGRKKRIDVLHNIEKLTDEEYANILGTEVDI